jgi:uncharacterized protein (TIGR03437 family)
MFVRSILTSLVVLMVAGLAAAQAAGPVIFTGGIVSAASLAPAGAFNFGTAPGGIVSIFGNNLAVSNATAANVPLPVTLNGTSVTIGGIAAPLFFVSATQINAQVPFGVSTGSQPVIVKTAAGTSPGVTVPVGAAQPGLFSVNQNGAGQAALQNAVVNGTAVTYVQNAPNVAIAQNGVIVAYGTGGGAVTGGPASGAACVSGQFSGAFSATLGGVNAQIAYAGCSPTYVGLDQWNITVPASLPDGCFLPLQVSVGGVVSNMVTVAVAKGGNCSSATSGVPYTGFGSTGTLILERFAVPFGSLLISTSQFSANFNQSVATTTASTGGFPPAGAGCLVEVVSGNNTVGFPTYSSQNHLDAGSSLTIKAPDGTPYPVPASSLGVYTVAPSLTGNGPVIATGAWTVTGPGGKDVGPFTAKLNIAQLFQVTNLGVTGSTFSQSQPLNFAWTCPDPSGQVIISVDSKGASSHSGLICSAACSAGSYTIPSSLLKQLPVSQSGAATLFVAYFPSLNTTNSFTATGLTSGSFFYGDATAAANISMVP